MKSRVAVICVFSVVCLSLLLNVQLWRGRTRKAPRIRTEVHSQSDSGLLSQAIPVAPVTTDSPVSHHPPTHNDAPTCHSSSDRPFLRPHRHPRDGGPVVASAVDVRQCRHFLRREKSMMSALATADLVDMSKLSLRHAAGSNFKMTAFITYPTAPASQGRETVASSRSSTRQVVIRTARCKSHTSWPCGNFVSEVIAAHTAAVLGFHRIPPVVLRLIPRRILCPGKTCTEMKHFPLFNSTSMQPLPPEPVVLAAVQEFWPNVWWFPKGWRGVSHPPSVPPVDAAGFALLTNSASPYPGGTSPTAAEVADWVTTAIFDYIIDNVDRFDERKNTFWFAKDSLDRAAIASTSTVDCAAAQDENEDAHIDSDADLRPDEMLVWLDHSAGLVLGNFSYGKQHRVMDKICKFSPWVQRWLGEFDVNLVEQSVALCDPSTARFGPSLASLYPNASAEITAAMWSAMRARVQHLRALIARCVERWGDRSVFSLPPNVVLGLADV